MSHYRRSRHPSRSLVNKGQTASGRGGAGHSGWLVPLLATAASALGAAAIYNNHRANAAERQHPPIGKFLDVNGVRLHYVERGHGPAVVLIHGNGTMVEDFVVSGIVRGQY